MWWRIKYIQDLVRVSKQKVWIAVIEWVKYCTLRWLEQTMRMKTLQRCMRESKGEDVLGKRWQTRNSMWWEGQGKLKERYFCCDLQFGGSSCGGPGCQIQTLIWRKRRKSRNDNITYSFSANSLAEITRAKNKSREVIITITQNKLLSSIATPLFDPTHKRANVDPGISSTGL